MKQALSELVAVHDLVISLVPYSFHPLVANHCLEKRKNLVTASYVSEEMAAFDKEATRPRSGLPERDRPGSGHRSHVGHAHHR